MVNVKDDSYYLTKILDEISIIHKHTNNLSLDQFLDDQLTVDACTFRIIQISEHISHLTIELLSKYSYVKWFEIKGIRNKLVHEYGIVDNRIVGISIYKDLPILKDQIEEILDK